MDKENSILLVYGGGGHSEQMKRLVEGLKANPAHRKLKFISICNRDVKKPVTAEYHYVKIPLFKKNFMEIYKLPISLWNCLSLAVKLSRSNKVKYIVSTGPGIGIIFTLLYKLLGKKIIFMETWSRFYSKSLTGKFIYYWADYFFIQNETLANIYPKSIYKGRL